MFFWVDAVLNIVGACPGCAGFGDAHVLLAVAESGCSSGLGGGEVIKRITTGLVSWVQYLFASLIESGLFGEGVSLLRSGNIELVL